MGTLHDWRRPDWSGPTPFPGEFDIFVRNDPEDSLYPGHPRHFWMFDKSTAVCALNDEGLSRIACSGVTHPGRPTVHATTARDKVTCRECLEYIHA